LLVNRAACIYFAICSIAMTYQQTLDYLYQQLPMFSRMGAAAYKKDLHNTIALCDWLGNPQKKFKSIHVAGTNGKGSTSHMLAAILQQSGYKTGLYTSPHLIDFGERIRINGTMIDEAFVTAFVEKAKPICQQLQPSFFELTVAMAFDWFAHQHVDIAVVETGLGGRLDSTNIIHPLLSIITNIGWDHMNILGNTLPEIAAEKAGIIKNGVPVVVGELLNETEPVFLKKAAETGSFIHFAEQQYKATDITITATALQCSIKHLQYHHLKSYTLDLNGTYQAKNLCTVLTAVKALRLQGFMLSDAAVGTALAQVKKLTGLMGRWQVIAQEPLIVLDVAHNAEGIQQVLQQLSQYYKERNVHFVIGMVKDKDVSRVLSLMPATARYYFTHAHIPRAMAATDLQQLANNFGLSGASYANVNEALASAKQAANKNDVIVVCGSIFLVGEVNELKPVANLLV
jgi:dihydrofolate synthase / folylpolyglutamate synthase